jgi:adenylosuccinate synthase
MTKHANAVIGAAYGDEAKGAMTDYLAWETGAEVVRTNGGAQAGHTVTMPDGRRHVFSHIGSGALAGAATHLSRFFAVSPVFFLAERDAVAALGGNTDVRIDPRAPVTTPFDIMVNQIVELDRGNGRHGSCGMGFGETVERNLRRGLAITAADLVGGKLGLVSKLDRIRKTWMPERLAALGVAAIPSPFVELLLDDDVIRRFLVDCEALNDHVDQRADSTIPANALFEGAQGLLLDQDYGAFPHVTRSNTGIVNMLAIAGEAGIDSIDATYMTRTYTTRHGAGPLAHEGDDMAYAEIVDPTNSPNDWQGTIRAAPLDADILASAIRADLSRGNLATPVRASIGVSCLDQVAHGLPVYVAGKRVDVTADHLPGFLTGKCGLPVAFSSHGPGRRSISALADAPLAV